MLGKPVPSRLFFLDFDILLIVVFAFSFMSPVIQLELRGYVFSFLVYFAWLLFIALKGKLSIFFTLLSKRRVEISLLLIYAFVALFSYFFQISSRKAFTFILMPIMYILILGLDSFYSYQYPYKKRKITVFLVLLLGVQCLYSIPYILNSEILVSRMFSSGQLEGIQLKDAIYHGVGGSPLYTTLSCIFFINVYLISSASNILFKIVLIVCEVCIGVSILISSFALPILMLLVGVIILIMRSGFNNILLSFYILTCTLGAYLLFSQYFHDLPVFEPVLERFQIIEDRRIAENRRSDLANVSLNTFFDYPFFGIGVPEWGQYNQVGEHMPWVDFLAQYGFFGFLPFIAFLLYLLFRNFRFYFGSDRSLYKSVCATGFLIFVFSNFINPLIQEASMIFLLLFYFCSVSNYKNSK